MKLGGDVADFTYRQAWIDGEHTYRITGKTRHRALVQRHRPGPAPGDDSRHRLAAAARAVRRRPRGATSSATNSRPMRTAISSSSSAATERAAELAADHAGQPQAVHPRGLRRWGETPTTLTIERIGMDAPRPMPTPERMIEAFDWAGRLRHRRDARLARAFLALLGRGVRSGDRQRVPARQDPPTRADDAKRGRMAAHMIWELRRTRR